MIPVAPYLGLVAKHCAVLVLQYVHIGFTSRPSQVNALRNNTNPSLDKRVLRDGSTSPRVMVLSLVYNKPIIIPLGLDVKNRSRMVVVVVARDLTHHAPALHLSRTDNTARGMLHSARCPRKDEQVYA